MKAVLLEITESRCRCGLHKAGEEYVVGEKCPPLCHELWNAAYPYVFALQNGAFLDSGDGKAVSFTVKCPDEGRVVLHGELVIPEN